MMHDRKHIGSVIRQAVSLAASGYRVFPLAPGSKQPFKGGGVRLASDDPEVIEKLFAPHEEANIGICTDSLLVVDIDVPNDAPESHGDMEKLRTAIGSAWDQAPCVKTPSGGAHRYFRLPEGLEEHRMPRSRMRMLADVDIKTGDKAYVVAPGSTVSGRPYEGQLPHISKLPEAPKGLLELLQQHAAPDKRQASAQYSDVGKLASIEEYRNVIMRAIREGHIDLEDYESWRNILFALATGVARHALDHEEAWTLLDEVSRQWPDGREVINYNQQGNCKMFEHAVARNPEIASPITLGSIKAMLAGSAPGHASDQKDEEPSRQASTGRLSDQEFIQLVLEQVRLWKRKDDGEAFATRELDGQPQDMPLNGQDFAGLLGDLYLQATGKILAPSRQNQFVAYLRNLAGSRGEEIRTWHRVAWTTDQEGHPVSIFIDPCWNDGRVIEITHQEWTIRPQAPVKFMRQRTMEALPVPERKRDAQKHLREFIRVETDTDFMLVVSWLLQCFMPRRGPYLLLSINGPHGAAKSSLTRMLKRLSDPEMEDAVAPPRKERDLFIAARGSHVLAFDNLSHVSGDISDALARIATGSAYRGRQLYSDDKEIVLRACNPVIINGIPDLLQRADLASRAISITLDPLPAGERKTERELWHGFDKVAGGIFGLLLDALSEGLRNLGTIQLECLGRMADAIEWASCCAPAFGWEPRQIEAAFMKNQEHINRAITDDDTVAIVLREFMSSRKTPWEGSSAKLYRQLTALMHDEHPHLKQKWPSGPASFGKHLARLIEPLKEDGLEVVRKRTKDGSVYSIRQSE